MSRPDFAARAVLRVPAVCLVVLLGACALPRPYTLNIQQGIVLDQKMISRLKPGMTRNQVSLTLGTPLLADPLHADRWDYVYYTRIQGDLGEWRRLKLLFKDDRLASVSGDVTVAPPAGAEPGGTAPAEPAAPGNGLPAPLPGSDTPPAPKS